MTIEPMGHGGAQDTMPGRLTVVATGELVLGAEALALPSMPGARLVLIRAKGDNGDPVYIGKSGVTAATGSTNTTAGYELPAGVSTPWLPVSPTDQLYVNGTASDGVTYIVLG